MLVLRKDSDDPDVHEVWGGFGGPSLRDTIPRVDDLLVRPYRHRPPGLFSPSLFRWGRIERHAEVAAADVITLNWVAGGFLDPWTIGRLLALGKPVVWRLSDMAPFTGGCHYSGACRRYESRCGACPLLGSARERDLSFWTWWWKNRLWSGPTPVVVAPSRWLAACASASSLFGRCRIEVLPAGVDISLFRPVERAEARRMLGLPPDGSLLLFGASRTDDPRKGGAQLRAAVLRLRRTAPLSGLRLAVFGRDGGGADWGLPCRALGTVSDDVTLALAYSAADVFVAPALEENLPNTVLEALACGTPTVAFRVGGLPDVVEHERNGYLAASGDAEDLARGIRWCLGDARRDALRRSARESVERDYSLERQAGRHAELYRELLGGKARGTA
jgi:glycosyltransferase involved in cell wall biosynthesis